MPKIINQKQETKGGGKGAVGQRGNGVEAGNQETPVATRNHQEERGQERGRPEDVGS